MKLKKFEANMVGNDYVIGDVHGNWLDVVEAMQLVDFDEAADRLFCAGDLVDRGPDSADCKHWLAAPWFHSVRGNHEQMAIDVFNKQFPTHVLLNNGGAWFLTMMDEEMVEYVDLFDNLPYAIEIDTTDNGRVGIVHAEVPNNDWHCVQEDDVEAMLWARTRINSGDTSVVANIDTVYVGHTPVNEVVQLGNVHYIDTGSVFADGKLTILKIN